MGKIAGWKKWTRTYEGSNRKFDTYEGKSSVVSIQKTFSLNRRRDEWNVNLHPMKNGMYTLFEGKVLGVFETKKEADAFAIKYMKLHSRPILKKAPEGYTKVIGATTNPIGASLYSNNKSRFSGERKSVLVEDRERYD